MANKLYSAISGSNTKIRAEQIKSEENGLETLAGELFAIKGQIADIIGEASFMEQAPSDVQMLDLHQHLNAQGAAELVVKLDLAASGSVHMLGTLDVDGAATLASATVEDLSADRLVASNGTQGLVSIDLVDWVAGTANQVIVSGSAGEVVLSLPQSIHTAASPQFAGVTVTDLTPGRVVYVGASDELVDSSEMTFNANGLTLVKDFFARSGSFSGDLTVTGDFRVNGALTYVDTQNLQIADKKIVIALNATGSDRDGAGIYLGSDASVDESIRWDHADSKWIASDKLMADTLQVGDVTSSLAYMDASGNLVAASKADIASYLSAGFGIDSVTTGTIVATEYTAGTGMHKAGFEFSIGQPVETSSQVQFAAVTGSIVANGLTNGQLVKNSSGLLVDADINDFISAGTGVTIDSSGSISIGQAVGTTDAVTFSMINLGSYGALSGSGDDLVLSGAIGKLYLADEFAAAGGWSDALGIKLSDSAAEWTNFEAAFGEVSLLAAIYQAGSATNAVGKYTKAIVGNKAIDEAFVVDAGLDYGVIGDASKKLDFFLNGQLMVSGSSADYLISSTNSVAFKFALENGDVVTAVVR